MNTTEENKLIAGFMGWDDKRKIPVNLCNYEFEHGYSGMDFHVSWNWLMPVVEKIESLGTTVIVKSEWNLFHTRTFFYVTMYVEKGEMSKDRSCIYNPKKVYENHQSSVTKINALYESVLEFIQWYNENKKS